MIFQDLTAHIVVPRPTVSISPGNFSEMQNFRPYPRPAGSESSNRIPTWLACTWNFWSTDLDFPHEDWDTFEHPSIGNPKECSNYRTIVLISHASKVMLKILRARLQQYVNRELPDVQAGFRKGRGIRDQISNIRWIIKKARQFQKNIYFCFIDYAKAFDCVDHNKLWKILKEMAIPDHLTCLLRNLYAGQEAIELDMGQQTGSK